MSRDGKWTLIDFNDIISAQLNMLSIDQRLLIFW